MNLPKKKMKGKQTVECKIRELRKKKHMSQEELAEKSGISRATISALENGHKDVTTNKTLKLIANALDSSVSEIFYGLDG